MAAELIARWAPYLNVELRAGSKGRFEVSLDGRLLFSKAELKRFPAEGEIVSLVAPALGPPAEWR